jgi:predicted nucleic acid-binding Zn ribbon protein
MIQQDQQILSNLDKELNKAFPCPHDKSGHCNEILDRVNRVQRRTFLQRVSVGAATAAAVLVLILTNPWSPNTASWDISSELAGYYYPEATQTVEFDISEEAILEYLVETEDIYQLDELMNEYTIN